MSRRLPWAVLAAVTLAACHTITEELPQREQPNPGAPAGTPVVVVPVPVPSPEPPAATPAPSNPGNDPSTPTPAPATPPPVSSQGCPLPPGRFNENCVRESPTFLNQVEAAIDAVIRSNPGFFDTRRTRGCGTCYLVVDPTGYVRAVEAAVTRNGVCGHYDGEELGVKNTNGFNDQFDILTSDLYIRRQLGSYRATCRPAWF
jgi:hypothetical protein